MYYNYFFHIQFSTYLSLEVTDIILVKQLAMFLCSFHESYPSYASGRCSLNSTRTDYHMLISGLVDSREIEFMNPLNYQYHESFTQEESVSVTVIFKDSSQNLDCLLTPNLWF